MGIFSSSVMSNYNPKLKDTPIRDFPRFDFLRRGEIQRSYLLPLAWALSFPDAWKHGTTITRDIGDIKPPYLIMANHNSFYDFKVLTRAIFPHKASYVVALDGFIGREGIMRLAGCIGKRKFTNDLQLIRQVRDYLDRDQIFVLYPEARYSLCGTDANLPSSLGKFIKLMKVPVVSLMTNGHHIDQPCWNQTCRKVKTNARLETLFSKEQVMALSAEELQAGVEARMKFDDFAWQKANHIKIDLPTRAEGLHHVLYQCPHCLTVGSIQSEGHELFCEDCRKRWSMDVYGSLEAKEGVTEFSHIPDWFWWQFEQVKQEIEAGTYQLDAEVLIDALPNSDGFVQLGKGRLRHDQDGLHLWGEHLGEAFEVHKSVESLYSIHVEFDYLDKKLDCIDISTLEDTYFVYPTNPRHSVTKMSFAVEIMHKNNGR